jgi:hypothetical protein
VKDLQLPYINFDLVLVEGVHAGPYPRRDEYFNWFRSEHWRGPRSNQADSNLRTQSLEPMWCSFGDVSNCLFRRFLRSFDGWDGAADPYRGPVYVGNEDSCTYADLIGECLDPSPRELNRNFEAHPACWKTHPVFPLERTGHGEFRLGCPPDRTWARRDQTECEGGLSDRNLEIEFQERGFNPVRASQTEIGGPDCPLRCLDRLPNDTGVSRWCGFSDEEWSFVRKQDRSAFRERLRTMQFVEKATDLAVFSKSFLPFRDRRIEELCHNVETCYDEMKFGQFRFIHLSGFVRCSSCRQAKDHPRVIVSDPRGPMRQSLGSATNSFPVGGSQTRNVRAHSVASGESEKSTANAVMKISEESESPKFPVEVVQDSSDNRSVQGFAVELQFSHGLVVEDATVTIQLGVEAVSGILRRDGVLRCSDVLDKVWCFDGKVEARKGHMFSLPRWFRLKRSSPSKKEKSSEERCDKDAAKSKPIDDICVDQIQVFCDLRQEFLAEDSVLVSLEEVAKRTATTASGEEVLGPKVSLLERRFVVKTETIPVDELSGVSPQDVQEVIARMYPYYHNMVGDCQEWALSETELWETFSHKSRFAKSSEDRSERVNVGTGAIVASDPQLKWDEVNAWG